MCAYDPRLQWPGAMLGVAHVRDLGPVEYMAAEAAKMLLIATPQRIYAISPQDPEAPDGAKRSQRQD